MAGLTGRIKSTIDAYLLGLVGCAVDGRDTGGGITKPSSCFCAISSNKTEDTPLSVESWLVNGAKSQNSAFYRQRFVTGN